MFRRENRISGVLSSVIFFIMMIIFWTILISTTPGNAKTPRSKFYDFNEQLIDGEIKKPTTLYTDSRDAVKFERLLKLKKSFLPQLFNTAKERVFK